MIHHTHPHPHHQMNVPMHPQQHPQVLPSAGTPQQNQHNMHRDQNRMNHYPQQRMGPQTHPPPPINRVPPPHHIINGIVGGGMPVKTPHQIPPISIRTKPLSPPVISVSVANNKPTVILPKRTIETPTTTTKEISAVVVEQSERIIETEINSKEQQQEQALTNDTLANTKEKTPMCLVNELARYNKIQHQYRLTGEQGPAHKKRFTVTLKLGDEEYTADGQSIKKSQHSAASEAIKQTKYKHPPAKTSRTARNNQTGKNSSTINSSQSQSSTFYENGTITPTVELNALAMKRGELAVYFAEQPSSSINNNGNTSSAGQMLNGNPSTLHQQQQQNQYMQPHNYNNINQQQQAFNPYLNSHQRGGSNTNNNNVYHQQRYQNFDRRSMNGRKFEYDKRYGNNFNNNCSGATAGGGVQQDEYRITLQVGQRKFLGIGHTLQAARHAAASKALETLKPLETTITQSSSDLSTSQLDESHSDLKSPISLVHELALKRNLSVTFEVQSEKGPPHMKLFITTCRVGTLTTEGEGNGKKISKKRSAEKMLDELRKMPPPSPVQRLVKPKRKTQVPVKKKSRNLIKEKQEPDFNPEEVNPISRLIQIQQARKEKEPIYTLVEERGAPRRREFVIEVAAAGKTAQGTGPNKKIAKRIAAENILELLGLTKVTTTVSPIKDKEPNSSKINTTTLPTEIVEKSRKVTFQENAEIVRSPTPTKSQGGSGGRQLVPGVLLVQQENKINPKLKSNKSGGITQQTATIAKELLNAGTSPTADALVKSGGGQKLGGKQSPIKTPCETLCVRPKDQLLYLAQLLDFKVNFSDFPKGNHGEYLTLITLTTEPPQLCHGSGNSTDKSHDQAAMTALKMLSDLGLDNVKKPIIKLDEKIKPKPILSNGLKK